MNPSRPPSDRAAVRAQAAAWIARLKSEERTLRDEAGFKAWLAERPENQEAFDKLTTAWEVAGGLAADFPLYAPAPTRRGLLRTAMAASAVGGTVLAGGAAAWWALDGGSEAYATTPGETRRLSFSDGSTVILDSDSSLKARLRPSRRDFRLVRGRAHFEVAKDPRRPFVVAVGGRQVFALGTVFDVTREATSTSVVLLEGRVAVQSTGLLSGAGEPRIMTPGERLTLADDGAVSDDRPNLAKLTAWQNGQAVFDNDSMADAVAELNRYSRLPIVIDDPAVARMRISGVFRAGATLEFANLAANLLPIDVAPGARQISIRARTAAN